MILLHGPKNCIKYYQSIKLWQWHFYIVLKSVWSVTKVLNRQNSIVTCLPKYWVIVISIFYIILLSASSINIVWAVQSSYSQIISTFFSQTFWSSSLFFSRPPKKFKIPLSNCRPKMNKPKIIIRYYKLVFPDSFIILIVINFGCLEYLLKSFHVIWK